MRAYRAAIIALVLGLAVVIVPLVLLQLASDDDDTSTVEQSPTITAEVPTGTPSPAPTVDQVLLPYFTELDNIFQRASDDSVSADTILGDALTEGGDIEAIKAAYTTFLTSTEEIFATAVVSMDAMTVPEAAQLGHAAFRAAADSSGNLAGALKADIAPVTSEDELGSLLEGFGAENGPLLEEADSACLALQETATTHGIDIDLACSAVE